MLARQPFGHTGQHSTRTIFGAAALSRATQQAANLAAKARNSRVAAEVSDLKEGLEMVEEKARAELGMVRPDEILVQVTQRR